VVQLALAAEEHSVGLLGDGPVGCDDVQGRRDLGLRFDLPPAPILRAQAAVTGQVSDVTVILDGRSTTVAIPAQTPILDGAQKARPDLPFACKGGICGTCRARVASGRADMRRNFALEESEVAAGYVLSCQSLPATKSLTVDYDA
jgi:ring-1,2-phenylacetyl-CoA epoxidase subunit PaaE